MSSSVWISTKLASVNVIEQVCHAALVCVIVRDILSSLWPHAPCMTTNTTVWTAAHSSAVVLHELFSVPLWILPVPSRVLSFTFLYVVEEKEPDGSQWQNSRVRFVWGANRCWTAHSRISFFHWAGKHDSDQWTGKVPSRHFSWTLF